MHPPAFTWLKHRSLKRGVTLCYITLVQPSQQREYARFVTGALAFDCNGARISHDTTTDAMTSSRAIVDFSAAPASALSGHCKAILLFLVHVWRSLAQQAGARPQEPAVKFHAGRGLFFGR